MLGLTVVVISLQVLMVTDMRRTDSITEPELFHYHDHFEFLSLIGETKTSQVFRVRHRITGEVFAVKRSRKRFRSKLQRERCLREIKAVAALPGHENIVSQYRAWQEVSEVVYISVSRTIPFKLLFLPFAGWAFLYTNGLL
jgi:serine/threonine protein kinase